MKDLTPRQIKRMELREKKERFEGILDGIKNFFDNCGIVFNNFCMQTVKISVIKEIRNRVLQCFLNARC
ncbi:hypothetical protein ATZ36_10620 [Candidatus Endomicrobiellum trichonymphae]|jgi:hypothetical protein|uniref:Uncharacterized protein n=1 Tax=Endomicrobium trichonymphae TaxID=1408204 RepID=A0A1E5IFG5_ENDTX|nr:hypothetical protein ATZ36_10620 [Candidatus Endomicrobium trichonymphae]